MTQCLIPSCFFPSTVVFVDDSREFLVNFTLQMDDRMAYRIFDSPYDALDLINAAQREVDNLNQRCVSEYVESNAWPMTNQTINIDLAAIHWEVYNPRRFAEVSVVIVDYAMPGMNGLEFCSRMGNSPVKKILLTGQADERTAIEAFNDGIIDRFVQKNDPNVTQLIQKNIEKLQWEYFRDMSDMVANMLAVNSPSCLQDPKFADFFMNICEENNIIEFYLTENSGSFLLLDEQANPSCLIMKTSQDLKHHYDLALDNQAPQEVLDKLKTGEEIPYFWQADSYQQEWNDWASCLFPAKRVECKENYYYVLIKDPRSFDIRRDKILSYHTHSGQDAA